MTCTAMCGSGAKIAGMIITKKLQPMAVRGWTKNQKDMSDAAVLGSTMPTTAVRLSATTSMRTSASTTAAVFELYPPLAEDSLLFSLSLLAFTLNSFHFFGA